MSRKPSQNSVCHSSKTCLTGLEIFIEPTRVSASRCEARTFNVRVRNLGYARAFHSLSSRSNSWLNLVVLRIFGYNCRIKLLTLVDAKMAAPASKHKRAGSARNWIWLNSDWPEWWISCSVICRLSVISCEDSNFYSSFVTVTTVVLLLVKLSVVHSLYWSQSCLRPLISRFEGTGNFWLLFSCVCSQLVNQLSKVNRW